MDIIVREVTKSDRETNICIDGSFIVDSALELTFLDGRMEYTVRERARYTKRYPDSRMVETVGLDYADYTDNPDQTMFLAFAGDAAVGRLNVKRNWNAYACIEDLAVDREYRRCGIGRRLMELAIAWAESAGMPGVMLETQNHNVAACRFYESCGFAIGGFDCKLYQGMDSGTDEVAIFWYKVF
ncbi:GNAT family N-acetyltransferase [Paenibacillus ginsengarvi]|uniref:GNAT family N-acetyltransferase n=1 Tax=Paenibacillus ginsengarvi TaxID=400777 RepID=A0A3B0CNB8_9BACL|nr:GNAT family N-acetyltransferase [Paenibacillus ginsengarvi]RKN85749.1 GNAT family N-acetyltransferase [Paenibacillus ginsengarvi]